MLHTERQLKQIIRALTHLPPVVVGAKGEVLAGYGMAQLANRSAWGRYIPVVKYAEMAPHLVKLYIDRVKEIARRAKWGSKTLAVELQNLQKTK